MARGFESKDVEYQQEEAGRAKGRPAVATPGDQQARARRQTLELALRRAEAEHRAATSSSHRQMLEHAMAALRARIASE